MNRIISRLYSLMSKYKNVHIPLLSVFCRILLNYIDYSRRVSSIDGYTRYSPVIKILKTKGDGISLLDVGSHSTGIGVYMNRDFWGVDLDFDYKIIEKFGKMLPVQASATELPFKDSSVDFIVSVDTLEHIPYDDRNKAVQEMIRVAKKEVIINIPVGEISEEWDMIQYNRDMRRYGKVSKHILDHIKNKLPKKKDIYKYVSITKSKWQARIVKEINLDSFIGLRVKDLYARNILIPRLVKKFFLNHIFYLLYDFIRDIGNEKYRMLFVIAKNVRP